MARAGYEVAEASRLIWTSDDEFSVDGVGYTCRPIYGTFDSTPERFCIRKPRAAVERLELQLRRFRPRRIVEVGIANGGSMALIAQLAEPERLIGIELDEAPKSDGVTEFARRRGLGSRLSTYWGVDQADGSAIARILADELGSDPLDLVIDDASHLLPQSRGSFEALFPRLRPGGRYLLEDWTWAHHPLNAWPDQTPLTLLVFEMTMACAHTPDAIAGLELEHQWAIVERGPAELDPSDFAIEGLIGDVGREIMAGIKAAYVD